MDFLATAPFGLESVVANELHSLGVSKTENTSSGVIFSGNSQSMIQANLWCRCADRILLIVGSFKALSFESLFDQTYSLPWDLYITKNNRFPVIGSCVQSTLMSIRDCQSIIKKAIVEKLRSSLRTTLLPETGSEVPIRFFVRNDTVMLTIDTSGTALNQRGYRTWNTAAPIRETLAASLLYLSPWKPGIPLHDPMCGSGTIPIEAAFIETRRAPGLNRRFAFEHWDWVRETEIQKCRSDARIENRKNSAIPLSVTGGDIDPNVLELANRHVKQAGLSNRIQLMCEDVRYTQRPEREGVFICNPPYGQRLSDRRGCEAIARALRSLTDRHPAWTLCVFTGYTGFERNYGKRAYKRRRLYNGRIECEFLIFSSAK